MELLVSIITALILLTSVFLLIQNRIHSMINIFVCQNILLAIIALLQAFKTDESGLYISAALIILTKVIFIPYLLRYFVYKLNIRRKVAVINHPILLLIGAAVLILFCYRLVTPISGIAWIETNNTIAAAMAVMLLGMLLLITHHKVIAHVIGYMLMENGFFFAALMVTKGMPLVVELGIAFEVLIAAVLFGVFFLQLRRSIDSLDVDRLNLLREDKE